MTDYLGLQTEERNMTLNGRVYTGEAASRLGVSKNTLLRWFGDNKIKDVSRDVRGWRVFSMEDIERIKAYANKIEGPEEHQRNRQSAQL